jgi:dihydrofolate reductase
MRQVIVSTNVTLDGRVDEVRGWALPFDDDEFARYHTDLLSHSDGLLLGRKTYEMFAAVWPSRSGESPRRRPDQQHGEVRRVNHAQGLGVGQLPSD